MSTRAASILAAGCVAALSACRSAALGPYAPVPEVARSTVEAEAINKEAADLIERDPVAAERALREALTKDLFFGPAHNNLGVVYLKQEKLYEAAGEFEWAKKLMPGHPDPRVNLAITLERAGRIGDAIDSYKAALEVSPEYLPAIEGVASLTVRAGRKDERLAAWLDAIAMRADSPRWRSWAASHRRSD